MKNPANKPSYEELDLALARATARIQQLEALATNLINVKCSEDSRKIAQVYREYLRLVGAD